MSETLTGLLRHTTTPRTAGAPVLQTSTLTVGTDMYVVTINYHSGSVHTREAKSKAMMLDVVRIYMGSPYVKSVEVVKV
jgi:hypothetical protein